MSSARTGLSASWAKNPESFGFVYRQALCHRAYPDTYAAHRAPANVLEGAFHIIAAFFRGEHLLPGAFGCPVFAGDGPGRAGIHT